jgi:hypothetical protein
MDAIQTKINHDGIDDVLVVDWQLVGCTYIFNVLVGLVSFIGLGVSSAKLASLDSSDIMASLAASSKMASLIATTLLAPSASVTSAALLTASASSASLVS